MPSKDDRLDAFVLADALRTDLQKFKHLPAPDPLQCELRAVSRVYEDLGEDLRAQANRLWQQLILVAPGLLQLCHGAHEPWFWDLCERTLVHQAKPQRRWVSLLLKRHHKRLSADDVLPVLRTCCLPGAADAGVRFRIGTLLPILRALFTQRQQARQRLAQLVPLAGRTAEIIDSHKGVDLIITAVFLAEAPAAIAAADLQALRTLAGTAPVTRRSGKSSHVLMRRSCNRRLRNALRNWAMTAITHDPCARHLYRAARDRGLQHERSLRAVADRLLARLVACLRHDSLYDPGRYRPRESLSLP